MGEHFDEFLKETANIVLALIVVATIAVLVSRSSKTVQFLQAAGSFFAQLFGAILKPISQ